MRHEHEGIDQGYVHDAVVEGCSRIERLYGGRRR
jgi:hypothetical protein